MSKELTVGCVLMAAGNARRFGENKLAAKVEGRTLIDRALDAIPAEALDAVVVVSQYDKILESAEKRGFAAVRNTHPDYGISHTIRLGIEQLSGCDALMFMVSDQPMLERETLAREIAFYRENSDRIVALGHDGVRGNPCIFPREFYPELLELKEDHGGNTVIRRHEDRLELFEVRPLQLTDVDSKQALAELRDTIGEA